MVAQNPVLKDASLYSVVGQSIQRLDLPAKIFGQPAYVQDLRLPGMLHGRTIHPPTIGATLNDVDASSVADNPDLVQVVRNGNYLAAVVVQTTCIARPWRVSPWIKQHGPL